MKNFILNLRTQSERRNREDGFTLVELMIVVVIIGILAAIAIPIFSTQQRSAIEASAKSDVANARSFIPASSGRVAEATAFVSKVNVTDGNVGTYYASENKMSACYQVSHSFDTNDVSVYHYLTSTGKIADGSCSAFVADPATNGTVTSGTVTDGKTNDGANPPAGGGDGDGDGNVPPAEIKTVTCANSVYTVTGDATISCVVDKTTGNDTNTIVTVTGTSTTPSIWTVQANFTGISKFNRFNAWTPRGFTQINNNFSSTYTFSGNGGWSTVPSNNGNFEYISSEKPAIVFTVQTRVNS